jgi:glycosyltransferase involved in cell wall biosynthesis
MYLKMKKRIAVVIPAYNEEHSIGNVVKGVRELGEGYEAVVINDNSSDRTSEKAASEGAIVIELPYNLGIGGAVQTGFQYAFAKGYDACVQVDGDGQHPTKAIPQLLNPLFEEGYDLVLGSRFVTDTKYQVSFMRDVGIKIISFFLKCITGMAIKDTTSGFRAINRRAMELFSGEYPQDYPEPESLIVAYKHSFKVMEVPVEMNSRMYGKSSITPLLSAYYMIKVLIAMFIDFFKKYQGVS